MVYYKDYDLELHEFTFVNVSKKGRYVDNIFTFDIETTNCFVKDGKAQSFDYSKNNEYYDDFEKCGYMYIWQFGIDTDVVFGRTWNEFREWIDIIEERCADATYIIYVHNLSFEMQFMFNAFSAWDIFARKTHKPMKASIVGYHAEFRCSYILTNMSLSSCAKNFKLPVQKLDGDLDYNILRNEYTVLTEKELSYCEYDILVTYYIIDRYKKKYGTIQNIPLTQTGEVRRPLKNMYKKDTAYHKRIKKAQPRSLKEFELLLKAFWGGYTHANALHTGDVIEWLHSHDFTSDYPAKMVSKKFPSTFFYRINTWNNDDYIDYAKIFNVKIWGLKSRLFNNFLSVSKCLKVRNSIEDNGRLDCADYVHIVLTDVDMDILRGVYDFDCILYSEIWVSKYEYIDYKFADFVLSKYENKTIYKGVSEQSDLYDTSKQILNGLYGMSVTCPINDEVRYTDTWEVVKMSQEEKESKVKSLCNSVKAITAYSMGVWVTAWARGELWHMIQKLDFETVYCDTDSIKDMSEKEIYFKMHNLHIVAELLNAVYIQELDDKKLSPLDIYGNAHMLGIWDKEKDYDKFVTMGAKKYCYMQDGNLHITVSGVSKGGADALNNIDEFKDGFIFGYENTGKLTVYYNDEQSEFELTDEQGNTTINKYAHGTCLKPTTYALSIVPTYDDYCTALSQKEYEC